MSRHRRARDPTNGKCPKRAVTGLWINEVGLSGKNVSLSLTPGGGAGASHRNEQGRPVLSTGLSTGVENYWPASHRKAGNGPGCSHAVGNPVGNPAPMSQGVPGE